MFERVIGRIHLAPFDGADFLTDGNQRITETVKFSLRLTFRRLDHEGARHWKGHGGCMETIVHKPLGDVLHLYPGFEWTHINDTFMGDPAVCARVENRVVGRQARRDVIRVEDRCLRRPG